MESSKPSEIFLLTNNNRQDTEVTGDSPAPGSIEYKTVCVLWHISSEKNIHLSREFLSQEIGRTFSN